MNNKKLNSRRGLKWITRERNGIMNLPEAKKAGLSGREFMQEQLKYLYSSEFLDVLNNEQIFDLFEEMIELPGLQHIKHEKPLKPIKPTPNDNVIPFPPEAITDWWKPRPGDPDYEEEI